MRILKHLTFLAATILCLILPQFSLGQQHYRYVDLGLLLRGNSTALGINNNYQVNGQQAGGAYFYDQTLGVVSIPNMSSSGLNDSGLVVGVKANRPAVWVYDDQGGYFTTLFTPHDNGEATALNIHGQIVGSYTEAGRKLAAYWDVDGTFSSLGSLGTTSQARSINQYGEVVGHSTLSCQLGDKTAGFNHRATLWRSGEMLDLGVPAGFAHSIARATNDAGQIIGVAYPGSGCDDFLDARAAKAMLYQEGEWVNLHSLSQYSGSIAKGINASGQITGTLLPFGLETASSFLWENGMMYDIRGLITENTPPKNWNLHLESINDDGGLAGTASYIEGVFRFVDRAFLLVPIR